ncbi:MAG: hypothetical protein H7Z12_06740 [Rhodospirillaceae bacterium]|nr:hypothetical protein [Rhodospirillales bacterium]
MPFTESKREQRRRLVVYAASETAALFSADLLKCTGSHQAVMASQREDVFSAFVAAYEFQVDCFKAKHAYKDGELINNAKITGLMLRTLLLSETADEFFVISPRFANTGIIVHVVLVFCWVLTCAILGIDRNKMRAHSPGYFDDFLAAIWHTDNPEPELLCLSMDSLWTAFGHRHVVFAD